MNNHPPESRTDPDDETLPCGRLLSRVWADWEDAVHDDHTAQCAHCRPAVADLERLESRVRALDAEPAQTSFDAASVVDRVMDTVRLELRPGRPLPLGDAAEDLRIMENAAARVLRRAAEEVPGVRAGSCRLTPGATTVEVALSVRAPLTTPDVRAVAQEVRRRVHEAADRRLGLRLGAIDVRVTDLVAEAAPHREEESSG
ncbi:Asp23/Gls24 family envelope stress response protein [Streptomyces sp. SID10692]|uniref:Asp23/Gls24 family envelope stress response protein n=1 Tax=Streptomyces sp. SID10692 TaxID=2706026 RepID=UPI0013DA7BF3|nr:Asp23/Gls24 family envelope stress response protein [Streptomyces sp. SID10692]